MHNQKILFFDHVPKCAGSSIASYFVQYFGKDKCTQLLTRQINKIPSNIKFASGHYIWGAHTLLPKSNITADSYKYFTFLRKPESIAKSYYQFARATGSTFLTFEEFITSYYKHNFLVDYFGRGSFDAALEKLSSYYFVGFVESFNNSMEELCSRLGMPAPKRHSKKNVSKQHVHYDPWLTEYFETRNFLDLELYETIKRRVGACADLTQEKKNGTIDTDHIYTYQASNIHDYESHSSSKGILSSFEEKDVCNLNTIDKQIFIKESLEYGKLENLLRAFESFPQNQKDHFYLQIVTHLCFVSHEYEKARRTLDQTSYAEISTDGCDGYYKEYIIEFVLLSQYTDLQLGNSSSVLNTISKHIDTIDPNQLSRNDSAMLINLTIQLRMDREIEKIYSKLLGADQWSYSLEMNLFKIVQYLYEKGDAQRVENGVHRILENNPYNIRAIQLLGVLNRKNGRGFLTKDYLFNYIDHITGGKYELLAKKEYVVNALSVESDPSDINLDSDYSEQIVNKRFSLDYENISIERLLSSSNSILFICCCPSPVIAYLASSYLCRFEGVADFIIGDSSLHFVNELFSFNKSVRFPSARFNFKYDGESLDKMLGDKIYDSVVILMSNFEMSEYAELFRYAETRTGNEVKFFFWEQIYTSYRDKFFIFT